MRQIAFLKRSIYYMCLSFLLLCGISQKVQAQTYCTPTYDYGCDDDYIQSFSTTGGTTNITNLNSGSSASSACLSNQTSMVHTDFAGGIVNFTIENNPGYDEGYKIFVDWNADGDFLDPGEIVYDPTSTLAGGASISGTFTIPLGTLPGDKRMRLRCVYDETFFDACDLQGFGEAEDYTLMVASSTPCVNPPSPGTIAAVVPDSICPNVAFTLGTTGNSYGIGLSYQWEQSATGAAGSWTNVPGAASINYTLTGGITTAAYYRLKSVCSGGTPVYSNTKQVTIKSFINCYCTPSYVYGCDFDSYIDAFSTSGATVDIANIGTGCTPAPSYADYTSMTLTTAQSFPFNFTVAVENYDAGVKIWADWNHDGIFDPVTELCAESVNTIPAGGTFTGTIMTPATALLGNTRLRIRVEEGSTFFDPCSTLYYGEAEDYSVNVITPPSCATVTFPTTVLANANPRNLCVSGNVDLSISSLMPQAAGITYQWQSSPTGAAPWTNVGTASATSGNMITGLSATTYYRLQILCSGTPVVTTSIDTVTVNNPGTLTGTGGARCGPGPVSLSATPATAGGTIRWYENAAGGVALGMGQNFSTPSITSTTTFYASSGTPPLPATTSVGLGALTAASYDYVTIFAGGYGGYKHQFLITEAEMTAAGIPPGSIINSIAVQNMAGTNTYDGFEVKVGTTTATVTTNTFINSGLATVYPSANYTTVVGVNTINFNSPYAYPGGSFVIQTCWSNGGFGTDPSLLAYDNTSYNATTVAPKDNSTPSDICAQGFSNYFDSPMSRRPKFIFNYAGSCESGRIPVVATVHDNPAPYLGADLDTCIHQGNAVILNPGAIPHNPTYQWDDASSNNTRGVTMPGTYYVAARDTFGCEGKDTINIEMRWNPEVDLSASGLTICLGGTKVLDAGSGGENGGSYYWNTGATNRRITIHNPGTYITYVTSDEGCMTSDTISIIAQGAMPEIDGIATQPITASSFNFSTINPQNVTSFVWDFGDGSAPVTIAPLTSALGQISHVFPAGGNYEVKLRIYSICGDVLDSTMISIVGLGAKDVDKDATLVQVYPNPNNGSILYVEAVGDVKIKDMVVYNALGQEVLTIRKFDSAHKHKVTLPDYLASGVYSLRINTSKGLTTRKLEIVK
ncbi:hypothetical protein DBR32_13620 [Taibaiella sp. KBW10]|uniref:GEVED domain-containing protein n=1 Tax=Taibaiella sp. KBW10 TaxID=2153357 RepID=UPI000F596AE1|nr:GEVED domain-containing protein [Taibaiella sp. KBW10]RQO29950.1 hypothetical protein DBR32_13620 [Taibaiella sp. KBW10]